MLAYSIGSQDMTAMGEGPGLELSEKISARIKPF
jgi:hypothetical protein